VLFGAYTIKLKAETLVRNEPNYELVDEPPPAANFSGNSEIGEDIQYY
jgi:hypothetical protein